MQQEMDCQDKLTNEETAVVSTYRQMIEWLSSLPDEEYERQMMLPVSANLTAFSHFRLRQRHEEIIDRTTAALFPQRDNQPLFIGA